MTMDMSLDIGNQFLQVLAAVDPQPAAALIDVGLDDLDLSLGGISGDRRGLVLNRSIFADTWTYEHIARLEGLATAHHLQMSSPLPNCHSGTRPHAGFPGPRYGCIGIVHQSKGEYQSIDRWDAGKAPMSALSVGRVR